MLTCRSLGCLVGLVAALGFGACSKENAADCESQPDDPRCAAPDGGGPTCTADPDCAAQPATPVCDLAANACVQCIAPGSVAACTDATPVCGDDNACRGCTTHAECPSQACLPDGRCAATSDVAYVAPTGTDNATCDQATPCSKVDKALATTKPYIKWAGTIDDKMVIDNRDVTILADPGATLTHTSTGILLEIKGTSKVKIYDLEISNGLGAAGIGISLPPGNTATLAVERVKLLNNQGGGIVASGGALTVTQSTISGNQGGGISVSGNGATFDITNTFIYRNGNSTSGSVGGLNLGIALAGTNRLEFNTIVDNDSILSSGGVVCNVATFMAPNNIIARNRLAGSATAPTAQTDGACTYPSSRVQNDLTGLGFVDPEAPAPIDYRLTAASTAVIDQATTTSPVGVDHDGEARPQGAQKDIGADEFTP